MKREIVLAVFVVVFGASGSLALAGVPYHGWQKGPWKKVDDGDPTVWVNGKAPTELDAYRADTIIPKPPAEVFPLLLDHDRARKQSFVLDYKVLKDDGHHTLVYEKIHRAGLGTREFTVRGDVFRPAQPNAGPYGFRWVLADGEGPDDPDVDNVRYVAGSWVLEPVDGGKKTRASFRYLMDPASWIPTFVLNAAFRDEAAEVVSDLKRDALR